MKRYSGWATFVRRTRLIAMFSAIGMHSLILILLISNGQNSIVWPWNMGMIFIDSDPFWRTETNVRKVLLRSDGSNFMRHFAKVVMVICGVLPGLSFVGLWDKYLSAALYSGIYPGRGGSCKRPGSLSAAFYRHIHISLPLNTVN